MHLTCFGTVLFPVAVVQFSLLETGIQLYPWKILQTNLWNFMQILSRLSIVSLVQIYTISFNIFHGYRVVWKNPWNNKLFVFSFVLRRITLYYTLVGYYTLLSVSRFLQSTLMKALRLFSTFCFCKQLFKIKNKIKNWLKNTHTHTKNKLNAIHFINSFDSLLVANCKQL